MRTISANKASSALLISFGGGVHGSSMSLWFSLQGSRMSSLMGTQRVETGLKNNYAELLHGNMER